MRFFYITGAIAWLWMTICLVIAARPSWIERVFRSPLDRLYVFSQMAQFCSRCNGLCTLLCERHFRSDPKTYLDASKPPKRDARRSGFWDLVWSMSRTVAKRVFRMAYLDSFDSCASLSNEEDSLQTLVENPFCFAWVFIFLSLHSLRLMKVSDFYMPVRTKYRCGITVVGLWASINLLRKGPGWQKDESPRHFYLRSWQRLHSS